MSLTDEPNLSSAPENTVILWRNSADQMISNTSRETNIALRNDFKTRSTLIPKDRKPINITNMKLIKSWT